MQKIAYSIPPFLIFAIVFALSYLPAMLLNMPGSNYPELPIDSQIPLVPWFVYFYFLTFPLALLAYFYLAYANKKELYNLFLTLCISWAISGIFYLCWQTEMVKPALEPTNFTNKFVLWTWGSTNPINCFPSQHCYMAIAMVIACCTAGKKMNIFYKIFTVIMAVMIVLSTVFLRQHFLLDFVGSFVIMVPTYLTVRLCKFGQWAKRKTYKKYKLKENNKKVD